MWPLLVYAGILLTIVGLGALFYILAVASTRYYRCPACGERVMTEQLSARRCGMCGAPLRREG
jgi:hypothetical protein